MKSLIYILYFLLLYVNAYSFPDEKTPEILLAELTQEIRAINQHYDQQFWIKDQQLGRISELLLVEKDLHLQVNLLIERDKINNDIKIIKIQKNVEVSKVRYLKGLQIIKILYEKVLSLDHHFSSVRTLGEINKITNPNQYPEFTKLKELVSSKKDKKFAVDLTSVLGSNSIVALVQTFTNMIGSSLTKEEKEKELANVECILDFTLRMQNDLNTIYFETAFLQTSNKKIKEDIETLFRDYTKPIGYMPTLEVCRTGDDWETVGLKMDEYVAKLKTSSGPTQYKMEVNMEFPIDRLLQFITQYNNFIDQGGKFYEKFKIILNSYENQKQCETKLPVEYNKLKADIDLAIQKFNVAYKPVEVNGSKMKEILYGLNEFE